MDKEIKETKPFSAYELSNLIGGLLVGPLWADFHEKIQYNRGVMMALLTPMGFDTKKITKICNSAMAEMAAEFIEMSLTVSQIIANELQEEGHGQHTLQ